MLWKDMYETQKAIHDIKENILRKDIHYLYELLKRGKGFRTDEWYREVDIFISNYEKTL